MQLDASIPHMVVGNQIMATVSNTKVSLIDSIDTQVVQITTINPLRRAAISIPAYDTNACSKSGIFML